ncbi:MAG TPA: autorepressor SdpR family transcription factor [Fimbriimonas sp.]
MSVAKTDDVYKALADSTRRRILRFLGERDMTAGELTGMFPISGPSMSHHFNVLKNAELIEGRREGQQIVYSLNTTAVQELLAGLFDLFASDRADGGQA